MHTKMPCGNMGRCIEITVVLSLVIKALGVDNNAFLRFFKYENASGLHLRVLKTLLIPTFI